MVFIRRHLKEEIHKSLNERRYSRYLWQRSPKSAQKKQAETHKYWQEIWTVRSQKKMSHRPKIWETVSTFITSPKNANKKSQWDVMAHILKEWDWSNQTTPQELSEVWSNWNSPTLLARAVHFTVSFGDCWTASKEGKHTPTGGEKEVQEGVPTADSCRYMAETSKTV